MAGDGEIDEGVADNDDAEGYHVGEDEEQHHVNATPELLRQVIEGTTAEGDKLFCQCR